MSEERESVLSGMRVRVCCRVKQPGGLTLRLKKSASGKLLLPLFCSRLLLLLLRPLPSQDIRDFKLTRKYKSIDRKLLHKRKRTMNDMSIRLLLSNNAILGDSSKKKKNGKVYIYIYIYTLASSERFNFSSFLPSPPFFLPETAN